MSSGLPVTVAKFILRCVHTDKVVGQVSILSLSSFMLVAGL